MNTSRTRLRWLYLRGPMWWTGLVLSLIGFLVISTAVVAWQRETAFNGNAVPAVAVVTGKESRVQHTTRNGRPVIDHIYLLVYQFSDASGRKVEGKERVSFSEWVRAPIGQERSMQYNGRNPQESRLTTFQPFGRWGLPLVGTMGVVFAAVGLASAGAAWVESARRARTLRQGAAALGTVDAVVQNDSAWKVAGTYRVLYHFMDREGASWEGRGPPLPWAAASRWETGINILVLYDPANPARNEPDVFGVRDDDLPRAALLAGPNQG